WSGSRGGRGAVGVIPAAPVALAYLLRAPGPVAMRGHAKLTAGTAVKQLLNDVYLRMPDNATQDAYFSEVARAVFNALFAQHGDPRAEVAALARSAGERRLLMWRAPPHARPGSAAPRLARTLPAAERTRPRGRRVPQRRYGRQARVLRQAQRQPHRGRLSRGRYPRVAAQGDAHVDGAEERAPGQRHRVGARRARQRHPDQRDDLQPDRRLGRR